MTEVYPLTEAVSTHQPASKTIIGKKEVQENLFTMTSHVLTDDWLSHLNGNEWKVVTIIDRWTTGFHVDFCEKTIGDIMRATGIRSDRTVNAILTKLEKLGIIGREFIMQGLVCIGNRLWINKKVRLGKPASAPAREYVASPNSTAPRPASADPMALPPIKPVSILSPSPEKVAPSPRKECTEVPAKSAPLLNKGKNIPTKKQQQKEVLTIPDPVPVETPVPAAVDSMDNKKIDTVTDKDAGSSTDTDAVKAAIESVCRLGISESDARDIIAECGPEEVQRQAAWYKERTRGKSVPNPGGLLRTFCRKRLGDPTLSQEAPTPAKATTRGEDPNLARIKAWAKEIQPVSWDKFAQTRGMGDPAQEEESASTSTDRTPRGKWDIGGGRPIRRPQSRYESLGGSA